ncbi:MAG: hypothetical protein AUI93_03015 [Crenarchaeota archaeon 13_1_40CM_3_52_10]|nr:MAG: hypothetical protein AUI93_03015 [Crenarchaeota archaeon 13_1_40CM_3_52_10]
MSNRIHTYRSNKLLKSQKDRIIAPATIPLQTRGKISIKRQPSSGRCKDTKEDKFLRLRNEANRFPPGSDTFRALTDSYPQRRLCVKQIN